MEFLAFFLLLISLSFLVVEQEAINQQKLRYTLTAFSLSILSIVIGILGMYFAFSAEEKSNELLQDRASFSPGLLNLLNKMNVLFESFTNQIHEDYFHIESKERLQELNNPFKPRFIRNASIEEFSDFYYIKLLLLTPFFGHAGFILKDEIDFGDKTNEKFLKSLQQNLFNEFNRLQKNIKHFKKFKNCKVVIITPPINHVAEWYAHIHLIETLKRLEKINNNTQSLEKIVIEQWENIKTSIETYYKKISSESVEDLNNNTIRSFDALRKEYQQTFTPSKFKNRIGGLPLVFSHRVNLPFQGLIVTKVVNANNSIDELNKNFSNETSIRIEEEVIGTSISLVGSSLYEKVAENLFDGGLKSSNLGLEGLINDLHSAFHSYDYRMMNIINNHFNQFWNLKAVSHFPCFKYDSETHKYLKFNNNNFKDAWSEEVIEKVLEKFKNKLHE